jgi:hypothetical protein
MTGPVTNYHATCLAETPYREPATAERSMPLATVAHARRALEIDRRRAAEADGFARLQECPTPALFQAGPALPVFRPGDLGRRLGCTNDLGQ